MIRMIDMLKMFDEIKLANRLSQLSLEQRLIFALSCCERLYPNYVFFEKENNWGDSTTLRVIIDFGWEYLESKNLDQITTNRLYEQCESITPDTEDFDSIYVSPALDAATSTLALLDLISCDSIDKVVEIASFCRDTVDMYIQEIEDLDSNDPEIEAKIFKHDLMQKELQKQEDDLKALANTDINKLSKKWKKVSDSNIGL